MDKNKKVGVAVVNAINLLGTPYLYGAETDAIIQKPYESLGVLLEQVKRRGVDCSEFVQTILWTSEITKIGDYHIKHFDPSREQFRLSRQIPLSFALGPKGEGTLVFMARNPHRSSTIYHVGFSLGEGWVIEATSNSWRGVGKEVLITHVDQHKRNWNLATKVDELFAEKT